jgi:hypothetical protein
MSTPEEQKAIELETIAQDHHLKMGEALNRLRDDPDFKTVILDGYLGDKTMASVSLLAVPQVKKAGERPDVMEDLISASNLMFFFKQVDNFYEGALNPVLSDDEEAELEDPAA